MDIANPREDLYAEIAKSISINKSPFLRVDSVIQSLTHVKDKAAKVDLYLLLAEELGDFHIDSALVYASRALSLSKKHHNELGQAKSHYWLGVLKRRKNQMGEKVITAIPDAEISLELFQNLEDPLWIARTHDLIGIIYLTLGELDSAENHLILSLEKLENIRENPIDSLELLAEIFLDIGNFHIENDTSILALEYLGRSFELYHLLDNQEGKARVNINIGDIYSSWKEFEFAEACYEDAQDYALATEDLVNLTYVHNSKGFHYLEKYDSLQNEALFREGTSYFEKNLKIQQENLHAPYLFLGYAFQYYADTHTHPLAFDSALYFYGKSLESAKQEGDLSAVKSLFDYVTEICASQNQNPKQNCDSILPPYFQAYATALDTTKFLLTNSRNSIHDFRESTRELKARNKQQNLLLGFGTLAFLLLAATYIVRQQQRVKTLEAQHSALSAQMSPHFIANTLNAIDSLVNYNERKAASKYIIKFSRLSRLILQNSYAKAISLSDELTALEHFLELEKLRLSDKLTYELNIQKDINPEKVYIPPMILQPYVENAIWHGIQPKEEAGKVSIRIFTEKEFFYCHIEDDGVGRDHAGEKEKAWTFDKKESLGTLITAKRIRQIRKGKVDILDLKDEEGIPTGTRVEIQLPLASLKKFKPHEEDTRHHH